MVGTGSVTVIAAVATDVEVTPFWVAVTLNVYAPPGSPVIVHDDPVVVHVKPPTLDVTVYVTDPAGTPVLPPNPDSRTQ